MEEPTQFGNNQGDDKCYLILSLVLITSFIFDYIQLRNRPKQPPKTYVAPFFLPSMISLGNEEVSGVENGVGIPDSNQELEVTKDAVSKILNPEPEILLSPFARRLVEIEVFNEIEASGKYNFNGQCFSVDKV